MDPRPDNKQHSIPLDHLMLMYQFNILIIISNRWSLSDRNVRFMYPHLGQSISNIIHYLHTRDVLFFHPWNSELSDLSEDPKIRFVTFAR